jgi:ABC-type lipoprotein export system ATPase subunit
MASKCFQDKTVTAEQWIEQAINAGLDCVAITDHNTGAGIDAIKEAAKSTNLIVFPSVEITCDTSKIHLLVLFDVDKSSRDVEDFLISCGINRKDFGEQNAYTKENIFKIVDLAKDKGGLVIPAHIDEFNGLDIGFDILKEFYSLSDVNAVHIVHKEFLDNKTNDKELELYLTKYYGKAIDNSTIKRWRKPVTLALENKKAILTFSDNPHGENDSEHGLWGIGCRFTWIKMEEKPTLESLRQAFLLPDFRVRNCFDYQYIPYKQPELWIKSITINNTLITDKDNPLTVEFSPQLNTIVGGRGSGKSSILRFIRGVFARVQNLQYLDKAEEDHANFYKTVDGKKNGVLLSDTVIEVVFIKNGIKHKITASQNDSSNQDIKIEKFDSSNDWNEVSNEGFIEFLKFEQYSQKQIYEIASKPNSLREIIDNSIDEVSELKKEKENIKRSFLAKSAEIRAMRQQTLGKGKLKTEIIDFEERINIYNQVHNNRVFLERAAFVKEKNNINQFIADLEKKEKELEDYLQSFTAPIFLGDTEEIREYSQYANVKLINIKDGLENLKIASKKIKDSYINKIESSLWKKAFDANNMDFLNKKEELSKAGISDINQAEQLVILKHRKEKELEIIIDIEKKLLLDEDNKEMLKNRYISILKEVKQKREKFVKDTLKDENVKIIITSFRNKTDFEQQVRNILDRDTGFQQDIEYLVNLCFDGKVEDKIKEVKNRIFKSRQGEQAEGISGHFKNLISRLTEAQLDEIELLMPEDEIEVQYKPTGSNTFKSLSTASAGQKTTAILTFILSHGEMPLILDQPEDDLDNRLVYDLIVKRLRNAKEKRQLIIVTHNANIPVNADAEYVISMDSESQKIKNFITGSVDSPEIKKEICAVMEGGVDAFKMRSERYNLK